MEEPRTQDARPQENRDVPRSRTPRAAFSAPEPATPEDGPTPKGRPAERARRQGGAKAAPAVTFQQPQDEESKSSSGTGSGTSVPGKPARVTQSRKGSAKANRAKSDAVKPSTPDAARPQAPAARTSATRKPADATPDAKSADAQPTAAKPVQAGPTDPKPVEAGPIAAGDSGSPKTDATSAEATPATVKIPRKAAGRRTATQRGAVPAEEVTPAAVKAAPGKRTPRKATTAAGAAQPGAKAPEMAGPDTASTELAPVAAAPAPAVTETQAPAADTPAPVTPAKSVASKGTQMARAEQPAAPVALAATTVATAAASMARYDWSKVVSDPGHTPELLALAAVETIGPRAAEWVRRTRESYPTATPQGLARLAIAEFTRRGTVGAALGAVAGSYAPMALIGAAVWTQAELVLHVAAAHGHDPADQARAAELLVLAKVHPTRADAEAALAAARQPEAGSVDARLRVGRPLATQVGGWLAIRAVNRFFPGTSVVLATLFSRGAAEMLGVRAIGLYEGKEGR